MDKQFSTWRKSSHSGAVGNCVETSVTTSRTGIRDSKQPDAGMLVVPAAGWVGFIKGVKAA